MSLKRILEPILLGCISNTIVSFTFKPYSVEFLLSEFVVACLLSVPITELNRYIDNRLEKKISWIEHPLKRFTHHLLFISFGLVVVLNILGNTYMWITNKGFFSLRELVIINLVTLSLAILLTLTEWAIYFYSNWVRAETKASVIEHLADELKRKLRQADGVIEVQKGAVRSKLAVLTLRIAKIELGTVRVYTNAGERTIFNGSLSELSAQLPNHLFFQAARDTILHREAIISVAPSTFGKIKLVVNEINHASTITVSRPKAALFRKWYNSTST